MAGLADINLNRLVVFVAVVEAGSITAAAKRLSLAKTMVSSHVQKLEAELGVGLLVRTTRRMQLTQAGEDFYQSCRQILNATEAAVAQAASSSHQIRGRLRLATSLDFASAVIAPLAAELHLAHPELQIEILASDQKVDLVAEGIDLAIRIGRLTDSSHKAALIGYFEEWLVAPPSLFPQGLPGHPSELEDCPFVGFSVLNNPLYWTFTCRGKSSYSLRFKPSIMANTALAVKAVALAGAGITVQPDLYVASDIAAGRLVRLLPEWKLPGGGIYGVFPARAQRPPKVGLFIEALKSRYAQFISTQQG